MEFKKTTLSLSYAEDQVKRYTLGHPIGFNIKLRAGREYFEGTIDKPDYYIHYWSMGEGVIMYSVTLFSDGLPVPIPERKMKRVNNYYTNRKTVIAIPIPTISVPKKPRLTFSGGGNSNPWGLIGVGFAIGFGGGGARLCEITR